MHYANGEQWITEVSITPISADYLYKIYNLWSMLSLLKSLKYLTFPAKLNIIPIQDVI